VKLLAYTAVDSFKQCCSQYKKVDETPN